VILDAHQLRAVQVRHNVVVSAGAGSGKTRVLTERYMDLLRNGEAGVPEILTLTFTRKAAAEMFGRIYHSLNREVREHPELRRELDRFDEARISTIDSFCAGILRDGVARFGLPPRVESDNRRLNREARRQALAFLLRHGNDPGISAFVRQYGMDGTLEQLLLPLITGHIHISRDRSFMDDFDSQQKWLVERQKRVEEEVDRLLERVEQLQPGSAGGVSAKEGCLARRGNCTDLYAFLMGVRKNFGKKGDSEELKEVLNLLVQKNSGRNTGLLVDWDEIGRTRQRAAEQAHLFGLLDDLRAEVLSERRASGILGHQEVMELAVRILREDEELRTLYADQFRYIMIDEFQDNNETQRDLLFLLAHTAGSTDPEKLFFVGDQKQSIYRFRGADVAVFRRLKDDVAASLPSELRNEASIDLPTNYRSSPGLIEFFNTLFPRVFGDAAESYEAEFAPLEAGTGETTDPETPVTVAWVPRTGETDDEGEEEGTPGGTRFVDSTYAEGAWIADEIDRLTADGTYRPGDIAILLRSSAGQQVFERMLRRKGVPYQTQAVRSLFTEAPANDLYALLQLQFYPEDREALAAYLRSPLVMLSDNALVRVMAQDGEVSLCDVPEGIAEEDEEKLRQGQALFEWVRDRLDRIPLYQIIRGIWDEGGYRYAILHRASDHAYLEHFDYLFSLALQFEDRPAVEFVDFLREQMGDTAKLDEMDNVPRSDAVQLMTIHKSKGLQFAVVFVADCDRRVQERADLLWNDPELGVTVRLPVEEPGDTSVNVIERHAREEERRRSDAELKRLLYVAVTRAERKLYCTASIRRGERGSSLLWLLRSALGLDLSSGTIGEEFRSIAVGRTIPAMTEEELRSVAVPQGARRGRSDGTELFRTAAVTSRRTRRAFVTPTAFNHLLMSEVPDGSAELGEAESGPEAGDAAELGTLTHKLLELLLGGDGPVDSRLWTPDRSDVRAILREVEPVDRREELCRESWDMARGFLESDLYRNVVGSPATREVHRELPFLLKHGDPPRFFHGTMDMVVEQIGAVHVIDFKTNRHMNPREYRGQMGVYRTAAKHLFGPEVSVSVHLFYLRFRESAELQEDLEEILVSGDLPADWDVGVQSEL
jgi:ATP-dependent exoDNAse (exonuclease V) beta subunit